MYLKYTKNTIMNIELNSLGSKLKRHLFSVTDRKLPEQLLLRESLLCDDRWCAAGPGATGGRCGEPRDSSAPPPRSSASSPAIINL